MSEKITNCLLCSGNHFTAVYPTEHPGLMKCTQCSLIFFNKKPSLDELLANYNNYPRKDGISPITIKRYHQLLGRFNKFRKTGKIIDVGCGNGHLLEEAKKLNWEVYGTEFTDTAVDLCIKKGISMQKGVLDVSNYEENSFDCLFFIEVIEHINNPKEELEKFHKLLRKGGLLYITTPNFNSISSKHLKSRWSIVEYPEHLAYYTPNTLHKILTEAGFKKSQLFTSGLGISSIRTKDEIRGSIAENNEVFRKKAETNPIYSLTKRTANLLLKVSGSGDTIKAIYIKQ
ncbi:MAG TPA: class I SAM-dependent methyltransferase [Bacteroidia bacterium]|nr:class I SAM-dependent methyltransferase [Bacteroidia bacterium]HQF27342.1 class I SAM-dependent methyltransferase [Bacteroidia bacterium]HQK96581.1 class I SAM-dependent methyltransferase [Bacteroidia bacterium]